METKFTPGRRIVMPTARDNNEWLAVITPGGDPDDDGECIALLRTYGDPVVLADARLIAAAPELYDLAENIAGFDESLLASADLSVIRAALREWRGQARAALGKADGGEP